MLNKKETLVTLTEYKATCPDSYSNGYFYSAKIIYGNYNLECQFSNDYKLIYLEPQLSGQIKSEVPIFTIKESDGIYAGPLLIEKFNSCKTTLNEQDKKPQPINLLLTKTPPTIKGGMNKNKKKKQNKDENPNKLRHNAYEKRTLTELRALAKTRKIPNYSKLTKTEIIANLRKKKKISSVLF